MDVCRPLAARPTRVDALPTYSTADFGKIFNLCGARAAPRNYDSLAYISLICGFAWNWAGAVAFGGPFGPPRWQQFQFMGPQVENVAKIRDFFRSRRCAPGCGGRASYAGAPRARGLASRAGAPSGRCLRRWGARVQFPRKVVSTKQQVGGSLGRRLELQAASGASEFAPQRQSGGAFERRIRKDPRDRRACRPAAAPLAVAPPAPPAAAPLAVAPPTPAHSHRQRGPTCQKNREM